VKENWSPAKYLQIKITAIEKIVLDSEAGVKFPKLIAIFYILLTVHLDVILVNDQLDALFLNVFISCLYMFRATSVHHQEDQLVSTQHLV
jgi:hypothetical protein